ncbi:MAG: hypothetical protein AB8G22_24830 [Saprospiraceae bacterium]
MAAFKQINANDKLYFFSETVDTPTEMTTAFLPNEPVESDSIRWENAWTTTPGRYFFLSEEIRNQTTFIENLNQYELHTPAENNRFYWINSPNRKWNNWQVESIQISDNQTVGTNSFDFKNYAFTIGNQCEIVVLSTTIHQFNFRRADAPNLQFSSQSGQYVYPFNTNFVLAFGGGNSGSFSFTIELQSNDPAYGHLNFAMLDVGIRYYTDHPDYEGHLQSLRYPIVDTPTSIYLSVNLNPLHHLDSDRTYFGFTNDSPILDSYFRTNLGQPIQLQPTESAKLVFAARPSYSDPNAEADRYTLVPAGAFAIQVADNAVTDGHYQILGGLSGLEYFGCAAESTSYLLFIPNQAAYAARLLLEINDPDDAAGLTDLATTSWGYIRTDATGRVRYFAQPTGAALYDAEESGNLVDYLDFLEIPVGDLPNQTTANYAFPLVAYTAIDTNYLAIYQQMALQVLSPTRRAILNDLLLPPTTTNANGDDIIAATPQGLLLTLDSTKTEWKELTLGHSISPTDATVAGHYLRFSDVTGDFKQALQSNQLFAVITNPTEFLANASIDFKLTLTAIDQLLAVGVPESSIFKLTAYTGVDSSMLGKPYPDQATFLDAVYSYHGWEDDERNLYEADLLKYCSNTVLWVNETGYYELTADYVNTIKNGAYGIPIGIANDLSSIAGQHYLTWLEFKNVVTQKIGADDWDSFQYILVEYAYKRTDGWEFNLSPYFWINDNNAANTAELDPSIYDWNAGRQDTIMILKYAHQSIEDLVRDTSTWAWSAAAIGREDDINNTQKNIIDIIAAAQVRAVHTHDFVNFVEKVTDPDWCGVLFLNVTVPLDTLPPELNALAAGIDPTKFYAHHLGIDMSPVAHDENGNLSILPSPLFGLIYYSDLKDQFYDGENAFAYKTKSLHLLIRQSRVESYSSQIELLITEFFDETATLLNAEHGNNLILDGVYQRHNGRDAYVFVENNDSIFSMTSGVLNRVVIQHAEMITVNADEGETDIQHFKFLLRGTVEFVTLPYFDAFSFGHELTDDIYTDNIKGLRFSGLAITMEYPLANPTEKTFAFDYSDLAFNVKGSYARNESFYGHFPLQIQDFQYVLPVLIPADTTFEEMDEADQPATPGDLGYMSVTSPLVQGHLLNGWFGFTYQLDLGTMGALTSKAGFKVEVFVGWSPTNSNEDYNVYIGLKLPGSKGEATEIPIEGVLKMVFKRIELVAMPIAPTEEGEEEKMSYILKFRSISLSLLGLDFPQGQVDMYIFGNPNRKRSALGWYACYAGE